MSLLDVEQKKRIHKVYVGKCLHEEYEYTFRSELGRVSEHIRHGKSIIYHTKSPNRIETICYYKMGLKHGPYQSFFLNGQLRVQANFYEGKWDGEYKQWYRNGQLRTCGKLEKRGNKSVWVGECQIWNKDGSPKGYWDGNKRLGKDKEEALEGKFLNKW